MMSKREKALRKKLKEDFAHYANKCLRIKSKDAILDDDGRLPRFKINDPQTLIHNKLEEQLKTTGKVRALILKARQQGASTYTQARFFWKITHRKGVKGFIITHKDDATANLFTMSKRFYDNCPKVVKPSRSASNAKELVFDKLDSGYKVGTAGGRGTGRSETIQYLHMSEAAYFPNADETMSGVLQAVADVPGSEVIIESTSAGANGMFYDMCMAADRGETEYILIFTPWFISQEYAKPLPDNFQLTIDEKAYKNEFNLTDEQIYWRRLKINELKGIHKFRREYPSTVKEAFEADIQGALWTRELIDGLRAYKIPELKRIVIGVDPSGGSKVTNDEIGIIVCGIGFDNKGYVLEDASGRYKPSEWGKKVVALYKKWKADRVIGERNFGGDMIAHIIKTSEPGNPNISYKDVVASRGKLLRAEPVASLYENGQVEHVGEFIGLEDQMCTWVPGATEKSSDRKTEKSPDRIDALVIALTELMLVGKDPNIRVI